MCGPLRVDQSGTADSQEDRDTSETTTTTSAIPIFPQLSLSISRYKAQSRVHVSCGAHQQILARKKKRDTLIGALATSDLPTWPASSSSFSRRRDLCALQSYPSPASCASRPLGWLPAGATIALAALATVHRMPSLARLASGLNRGGGVALVRGRPAVGRTV
ncbi:hairy/enhancer-of-split related with YRPW motif-like protein isoform X1 [Lates japonicus]|uniref:Hairy/enhancer-of-split related with YRPW motif-like protein isoform X1 n=1 Tax=Lates japonicus TaxID=270547 RepID=A0AAD3RMQ8_LATJO|nr:hairy/enhancer-of-split related with YRPW motif-like protein isoform X1 [Lates japonicus]